MTDEEYQVLGDQVARELELVGTDGFDWSSLASFAGKAGEAGVAAASSAAQKAADKKTGKTTAPDAKKDTAVTPHEDKQPGFFTAVHYGLPTWGWMLGGTAVLAGGFLLMRRKRR